MLAKNTANHELVECFVGALVRTRIERFNHTTSLLSQPHRT